MISAIKSITPAGEFEAVAWRYGVIDRQGEKIEAGAFAESLKSIKKHNVSIPVLMEHDTRQPVGSVLSFEDGPDELIVKGRLAMGLERAKEAHELLKAGALGVSLGFLHSRPDSALIDGVRTFKKADIFEVSLTTTPANPAAQVRSVKSFADCESVRDFEVLVREALNLSRRQSKKLASVGYAALIGCDAQSENSDAEEILSALKSASNQIMKAGKLK